MNKRNVTLMIDGVQHITCSKCLQEANEGKRTHSPIAMIQLHSIESMTICALFCDDHDGKFPYIADDGKFKFMPHGKLEPDSYNLSDDEWQRIGIDTSHWKKRLDYIINSGGASGVSDPVMHEINKGKTYVGKSN